MQSVLIRALTLAFVFSTFGVIIADAIGVGRWGLFLSAVLGAALAIAIVPWSP